MIEVEAKEIICEIGRRMYAKGYVAANDGNISVKIGSNAIWATPTGVSKGFMTPDMLVKVDLEGNVLEGSCKPSSEVKMHLRIYNENPEVNAVVHAHPPMATAFAIAGISLDKAVFAEPIMLLGVIPVTQYATPGTQEVPDSIAPFCKDYNAVLLANHGALTWGRDAFEAYFRLESLEHYAQIYMYTEGIIRKSKPLNPRQVAELIKIREKIGIKGGGVPVSEPEQAVDTSNEELIKAIAEKVTMEVLDRLKWNKD